MKVHISGSVWHAGLSYSLGQGFRELGHEVIFFNEGGSRREALIKKIMTRLSRRPYAIDDRFRKKIGILWLESLRLADPDVIILEYTPNILPEYIKEARTLGKPIVYWMTSPPDGFQSKEILLGMQFPDIIFTIDRQWVHFLQKFSYGTSIGILPLAGSEQIFHPLIKDHEARERRCVYDIVFIGAFTPQDASASWRGSLLNSIPDTYNVGVFGTTIPYWSERFPNLLKYSKGPGVSLSAEKMNEVYNQAKIALNIHSTGHLSSISARTFEIGLADTFQIVDFREDLEVLFPKNVFVNFKAREEMLPLITEWIKKPQERWDNADRIRSMVLERHTWKHRAQTVLDSLKV